MMSVSSRGRWEVAGVWQASTSASASTSAAAPGAPGWRHAFLQPRLPTPTHASRRESEGFLQVENAKLASEIEHTWPMARGHGTQYSTLSEEVITTSRGDQRGEKLSRRAAACPRRPSAAPPPGCPRQPRSCTAVDALFFLPRAHIASHQHITALPLLLDSAPQARERCGGLQVQVRRLLRSS